MKIFQIFADGKNRGITVTTDPVMAHSNAVSLLTRKTDSKDGGEPDFQLIEIVELA